MKSFFVFVLLLSSISLCCHAQITIEMHSENGVNVIPCKVNGLNLKFIFDTGASDVSISLTEVLFMIKNGYLDKSDIIGEGNYEDATGNVSVGTNINLKEIEFGGITLHNVRASVVNTLNAPLLLGQSAIKLLGEYEVNGSRLTILNGSKITNDSLYYSHIPASKNDLKSPAETKLLPVSTSPENIINENLKKRGGVIKMRSVKDVSIEAIGDMNGQMVMREDRYKFPSEYKYQLISPNSGYRTLITEIVNNRDVIVKRLWKNIKLSKEEKVGLKMMAVPFLELQFLNGSYIVSFEGIEKLNNQSVYVIKATNQFGYTIISYYDPVDFLCLKRVYINTVRGISSFETYGDYREVDGILCPFRINYNSDALNILWHINYILFNTGLKDDIFR